MRQGTKRQKSKKEKEEEKKKEERENTEDPGKGPHAQIAIKIPSAELGFAGSPSKCWGCSPHHGSHEPLCEPGISAGNTQGLVIPPELCQQEAEAALDRDHFPGVKGTWENPDKLRKHPPLPSWSLSLDAEHNSAALFAALLWHF